MESFSEYLNKLVNSSLSSQQEKSIEENISVLTKNLCTEDEIIKKVIETQTEADLGLLQHPRWSAL